MTKRTLVFAGLLSVLALGPAWAEPSLEVDASETAIVFAPETAGATEAVFFVWSRKHEELVTMIRNLSLRG